MADDAALLEAAPEVPESLLSPLWGTLLSLGGLVLVAGSLGYAVIQMSAYEREIAGLRGQLAEVPEVPVTAASPEPTLTPSETPTVEPSAPPTVYVTETVAATPAPTRVPQRQPIAGNVDRTRQLEAQVASLRQQLEQAQAERDRAKRDAASAQQCQSRLSDAQQVLKRARNLCRATGAVTAPTSPRPQ